MSILIIANACLYRELPFSPRLPYPPHPSPELRFAKIMERPDPRASNSGQPPPGRITSRSIIQGDQSPKISNEHTCDCASRSNSSACFGVSPLVTSTSTPGGSSGYFSGMRQMKFTPTGRESRMDKRTGVGLETRRESASPTQKLVKPRCTSREVTSQVQ